jgi:hypothetical protein
VTGLPVRYALQALGANFPLQLLAIMLTVAPFAVIDVFYGTSWYSGNIKVTGLLIVAMVVSMVSVAPMVRIALDCVNREQASISRLFPPPKILLFFF